MLERLIDRIHARAEHRRHARRRDVAFDWRLDTEALRARLEAAIRREHGHVYLCVHDFLPADLYRACVAYWPEPRQFAQRRGPRLRMLIAEMGETLAPDVHAFWKDFHAFLNDKVKPAIVEVFTPYLAHKFDWIAPDELAWVRANLAFAPDNGEALNLDRWFSLGAHVDQAYIFVSSLIYMPPDASQAHRGTSFFRPKVPLRTVDTQFLPLSQVVETKRFPFVPNTLVSFLQTPTSFHGTYRNGFALKLRKAYHFNIHLGEHLVRRVYGARQS